MKYFIILFNVFMIISCSKTPNDAPIASYQGVEAIVTFSVNMSPQIETGNFNVDNDYLDIAGNFLNNWNGTEDHLIDTDGDGIYKISFINLESGDVIEFKFRINGSWDTAEFPGGANRTYTVEQGENSLEYWFNDENGN